MLTYDEALQQILQHTQPLPQKRMRLENLLGYVLADPVMARTDLPAFDNSAVDGYGVLLSDTSSASVEKPARLKLLGEIQAGSSSDLVLSPGTALKIFTGALVPPSVEAMVMREECETDGDSVLVMQAPQGGDNIRRRGAEVKQGMEILPAGIRVTPPVVGMLATLGYASFIVREKPRVAVIVTGDELVKPGVGLQPGQIYDSNSYALQAALMALGIEEWQCLYAKDTRKSTRQAFGQALELADVVISAGGVSVGDYDYVKEVLEDMGVNTIFWRIAIKPGKPVYFGTAETPKKRWRKLVFGLPGNPVSALVTYHQLVKPALLKMMGATASSKRFVAALAKDLKKKPGRLDFVRAMLWSSNNGELNATPTVGQDSHMLTGLVKADALVQFAADDSKASAGTPLPVDLLNWFE